jgi:hypothetical protein
MLGQPPGRPQGSNDGHRRARTGASEPEGLKPLAGYLLGNTERSRQLRDRRSQPLHLFKRSVRLRAIFGEFCGPVGALLAVAVAPRAEKRPVAVAGLTFNARVVVDVLRPVRPKVAPQGVEEVLVTLLPAHRSPPP